MNPPHRAPLCYLTGCLAQVTSASGSDVEWGQIRWRLAAVGLKVTTNLRGLPPGWRCRPAALIRPQWSAGSGRQRIDGPTPARRKSARNRLIPCLQRLFRALLDPDSHGKQALSYFQRQMGNPACEHFGEGAAHMLLTSSVFHASWRDAALPSLASTGVCWPDHTNGCG